MADIQKVEIERYRSELVEDTRKLVDKYLSISDWDIPEIDEAKTVSYILQAIRETLDTVEKDWKTRNP